MSIGRMETGARMSRIVIHGDTVYLAGLTANKTAGQSLAAQTEEILATIDGLLSKAGTDKSKLLNATIWLSDIRTVDEMNKVWDTWVPTGCAPARACIEALLQGPEKKVEIQVTAAR
jgi:enamine deaminase RidA (YjgF/YER057c/UK114 family)